MNRVKEYVPYGPAFTPIVARELHFDSWAFVKMTKHCRSVVRTLLWQLEENNQPLTVGQLKAIIERVGVHRMRGVGSKMIPVMLNICRYPEHFWCYDILYGLVNLEQLPLAIGKSRQEKTLEAFCAEE